MSDEIIMKRLVSISIFTVMLFIFSFTTVKSEEFQVFSLPQIGHLDPILTIPLPRDRSERSRRTVTLTLKQLRADRAQGVLRLGQIYGDFSNNKLFANLNAVCKLLPKHLAVHNAEYFEKYGHDIEDIQITDATARRESSIFSISLEANAGADFLKLLGIDAKFSGSVELTFKSNDARERYFANQNDIEFLFDKVAGGTICKNKLRPKYANTHQYFITNYAYGEYQITAKGNVGANIFGIGGSVKTVNGGNYYGAFAFRYQSPL